MYNITKEILKEMGRLDEESEVIMNKITLSL